jgi:hypothetical protein
MCLGGTGEVANIVSNNEMLVIFVTLEGESPAINVTEIPKII